MNVGWHNVLTAAVLLLATAGCRGLPKALDSYVQEAQKIWNFSGVVAVAREGQVILLKGYGYADTDFRDGNTPQTKFFIGSITKQFTAAGVLLLQERGQLSLTDPLTRYLPDYPHDPGDRITLHHLLSHTSGLPNYTDFPEIVLSRTAEVGLSDIIESFREQPLDFEPGTDFRYSNSNYILLGAVIEAVSGQSYEAFLHKELLKPLGMLSSGYGRREMGHPNRAEGYTVDASGHLVGAVPIHFSILHSAGALYTTAEDLLKWDKALLEGSVLSPYSVAMMMTQHAEQYGYGWWLEQRYGRSHALHDGFLDGFNCTFDRWLEDDLSVIVFSNDDQAPVQKIARGLASIVFGRKPVLPVRKSAVELAPTELTVFEGVYRSESGTERFVVLESDTLHTWLDGQNPEHIFPESPDRFCFAHDHTETLTFNRNAAEVASLDYSDGEDVWRFVRSNAPAPRLPTELHDSLSLSHTPLGTYLGQYALNSDSMTVQVASIMVIALCGEHLCAVTGEGTPSILLPGEEDRFYQPASGLIIEFVRDSTDEVSGCVIELGGEQIIGRRVSFLD